jgi:ribonuclease VapC
MIIDTSVLIAILRREPGYHDYIVKLANAAGNLSISASTMLEAHIVLQRIDQDGLEQKLVEMVENYTLKILPFTPSQSVLASDAHRKYGRGSGHPARLNFGDCFAYALAKESGEPLLFKGNDFSQTDIKSALS